MKPVVVRNIQRADANMRAGVLEGRLGVSTAHEALGRSGLMKPYMRPIWSGRIDLRPAPLRSLAQPGDNWMIHVAIEQCKPGDVAASAAPPTILMACSATCSPLR